MFKWIVTTIIGSMILTGCSSCMIKQECEKVNWFEHGKKVALQGKYLEEDDQVLRCKKVDEISHSQIDKGFKEGRDQYCTLENIYQNALLGTPVNFRMCEGMSLKNMQAKFAEGTKLFCTADSGYRYGSGGETYKNVCSPEQEKQFMPSYHKGRSTYLTSFIKDKNDLLQTLQKQENQLSDEINRLNFEVNALPRVVDCRNESILNKVTNKYEEHRVCEEPMYIKSRRDSLYSRMSSVRSDRDQSNQKIKSVEKDIEWARTELTKIPK